MIDFARKVWRAYLETGLNIKRGCFAIHNNTGCAIGVLYALEKGNKTSENGEEVAAWGDDKFGYNFSNGLYHGFDNLRGYLRYSIELPSQSIYGYHTGRLAYIYCREKFALLNRKRNNQKTKVTV